MQSNTLLSISTVLTAALATACSAPPEEEAGAVRQIEQAQTAAQATQIVVSIPRDLPHAAVIANDALRVGDRAKVVDALGLPVAVANLGSGQTEVGHSARTGTLYSRGNVLLRSARIWGNVYYSAELQEQLGTLVLGSRVPVAAIETSEYFSWTVNLPSPAQASIWLEPDQSASHSPGAYNHLRIASRSQVSLAPGSYLFEQVTLEPQSTLRLDNAEGDYTIYVRDRLTVRGSIAFTSAQPNVMFVYLGDEATQLSSGFTGHLVAPHAHVTLDARSAEFVGGAYARSLNLEADSTVRFRQFQPTTCDADELHPCGTSKPGCVTLTGCAVTCSSEEPVEELDSLAPVEEGEVWGFADLHAHPATHLGFGATDDGPGMFHGSPYGFAPLPVPLSDLLPPCHPAGHNAGGDMVLDATRKQLVQKIDGLGGHVHSQGGAFDYSSWPSAQSVIHQQMHVDWIRRAYDGGLRLVIAAVTDNRMLDKLWNTGLNFFGNPLEPDPSITLEAWDKQQAEKQLTFIHQLVGLNSDWMQIVSSSSQARSAIGQDKLAIVLSLEMDSLDLDSILQLREDFQVAHVTPIHLANNRFGGTAIYSDLFEANSAFLNEGNGVAVRNDPNLNFRLNEVQRLQAAQLGALKPTPQDSGHRCEGGGHANTAGLEGEGETWMRELMRAGLLIDVAHMSERAIDDTLAIAEESGYPIMNSHTGVRHEGPLTPEQQSSRHTDVTEREMSSTQVERIAALDGVIGLGTAGDLEERELSHLYGGEAIAIGDNDVESWSWHLQERDIYPADQMVESVDIALRTANHGKRACNEFDVRLGLRSGETILIDNLADDEDIQPRTWWEKRVALPGPVRLRDIVSFELDFDAEEKCGPFDSNADLLLVGLRVLWNGECPEGATTCHGGVLVQRESSVLNHPDSVFGGDTHAGRFVKLSAGASVWQEPIDWAEDEGWRQEPIEKILVRIRTGDDDFNPKDKSPEGLAKNKITVSLTDRCTEMSVQLPASGFSGQSDHTIEIPVGGAGVTADTIDRIALSTATQCDLGFPLEFAKTAGLHFLGLGDVIFGTLVGLMVDACVYQDNWNLDRVEILVQTGSGLHRLELHAGGPWLRTTGSRTGGILYTSRGRGDCDELTPEEPVSYVAVHMRNGPRVPGANSQPFLRIQRFDGTEGAVPLNPAAHAHFLSSGQTFKVLVPLPAGTRLGDIEKFSIDGVHPDELWEIEDIRITLPKDPVAKWNQTYRRVLSSMGGRGVALGTDLNGLQHQMPFATTTPSYPFDVLDSEGQAMTSLDRSTYYSREFDFSKDGIAHYGMLADFAAAVRTVEGTGADSADRLFRSAEDVIRMWERTEAVAATLD